MNEQMVFKRHEIKYMISSEQQEHILAAMSPYMIADSHGKSTIQSLYLDTPDHLLVRRSMEHPLYKEKLRIRSYGVATHDASVFLELKKKYNSIVYKRRVCMSEADTMFYIASRQPTIHSQIMQEIDFAMHRYPGIAPAMLLSYDREAFYAADNHEFRITFDSNILWRTDDLSLCHPVYGTALLAPNQVLMEIKTADAIPLWMVRLLSELHIYKCSFSKYGTAYRMSCPFHQNVNPIQTSGGIYRYA